jgi:hypothetical protein
MIDSDGNQYGIQGDEFITGPPPDFDKVYTCLGQPQRFTLLQSVDPDGSAQLGMRLVSQTSIDVTFEPQFTDVEGSAAMSERICVSSATAQKPRLLVRAGARASRRIAQDCFNERLESVNVGACSSARARFGGLGTLGFVNRAGNFAFPGEFVDLTAPNNEIWVKHAVMFRLPQSNQWFVEGGLSTTLVTRVAEATTGSAFADLRFHIFGDKNAMNVYRCPALNAAPNAEGPHEVLPFPAWFLNHGDATPDDFTLAVSPPTGPITMNQAFDLAVMADTGGAAVVGISGTIDGLNVSGPLAACLAPTTPLGGLVQGQTFACRGLSGRFLAGIFGPGAHTIAITAALSDGRTISGDATWTIRP